MTQQIDALQRGASRRGQACFTMPGRPIHPELSSLVAKDDTVIAESGTLLRFLPEPGYRGFPGPGLTGEQITLSAGVHYPAGVHFDPAARRQQMDDQQFIEGVCERVHQVARRKIGSVDQDLSGFEILVKPGHLIWKGTPGWGGEVKPQRAIGRE